MLSFPPYRNLIDSYMEKYRACAGIHATIVVEMPLHNTRIPLERTIVFTERYFEY